MLVKSNRIISAFTLIDPISSLDYCRKKTARKKTFKSRNDTIFKSGENGHFWKGRW